MSRVRYRCSVSPLKIAGGTQVEWTFNGLPLPTLPAPFEYDTVEPPIFSNPDLRWYFLSIANVSFHHHHGVYGCRFTFNASRPAMDSSNNRQTATALSSLNVIGKAPTRLKSNLNLSVGFHLILGKQKWQSGVNARHSLML